MNDLSSQRRIADNLCGMHGAKYVVCRLSLSGFHISHFSAESSLTKEVLRLPFFNKSSANSDSLLIRSTDYMKQGRNLRVLYDSM